MLLHDSEELNNDFANGTDKDLTLASSLGDNDSVEAFTQNIHTHHG